MAVSNYPYQPMPVPPPGGLLGTLVGTQNQPLPPEPPLEDDDVVNQMNRITAPNSQYMRLAETQGKQLANRRGLLNTSMAVGAAQASRVAAAAPLAQANSQNIAARNQQRLQTSGQMAVTELQGRNQREIAAAEIASREAMLGRELTQREAESIRSNQTQRYGTDTQAQVTRESYALQERMTAAEIASREAIVGRQLTQAERESVRQDMAQRHGIDTQAATQRELSAAEIAQRDRSLAAQLASEEARLGRQLSQAEVESLRQAETQRIIASQEIGLRRELSAAEIAQRDRGLAMQLASEEARLGRQLSQAEVESLRQAETQRIIASQEIGLRRELSAAEIAQRDRGLALQLASEEARLGRQLNQQEVESLRQAETQRILSSSEIASRERMLGTELASREGMLGTEIRSREQIAAMDRDSALQRTLLGEQGATDRANLDAATRMRLQEFENMSEQQKGQLVAYLEMAGQHTRSLDSLYANKDMPAAARDQAIQQMTTIRNATIDLIRSTIGVPLSWGGTAPTTGTTAPATAAPATTAPAPTAPATYSSPTPVAPTYAPYVPPAGVVPNYASPTPTATAPTYPNYSGGLLNYDYGNIDYDRYTNFGQSFY